MTRRILAVAVVVSGFVLAGCSGPAQPVPAPTATTAPAPSTTAPCAGPFALGQPVTAELGKLGCTEPNGVAGVSHTVVCKDGRMMIFDSALSTYGFPGGKLAVMDTAADSAYARDYAKCQTG